MTEQQAYSPETERPRELLQQLMKPMPTVVGVEGGPCSGKTTLANRLREVTSQHVVVLPEMATKHIMALAEQGIDFGRLITEDRQTYLEVERLILRDIVHGIEEAQEVYAGTDVIIVVDRCDIGAYVTEEEYTQLLEQIGLEYPPMLTHVDKLVYLPSLAEIEPQAYEIHRTNNPARAEQANVAVDVSRRNLAAIARHPELEIAWGGEFEETMSRLVDDILNPDREAEVKFEPYDEQSVRHMFETGKLLSEVDVSQSYHRLDNVQFRLRETVTARGERIYAFTIKSGRGVVRHEHQRRIDKDTYSELKLCTQIGQTLKKRRSALLRGEGTGTARLWTVDRYDTPQPTWHIETNVTSDSEADEVAHSMSGVLKRTHMTALDIAKPTR